MNKSRLGRGLNALIPQQEETEQIQNDISNIKVSLIKPNPYQPRIDFDKESLEELKQSIREKGIIQPITVHKKGNHFELIAGERRLRAAIEIELEQIPAYIIKVDSKEEMLELIKKEDFDIVVTMGAGDIDRMANDIVEILKTKK